MHTLKNLFENNRLWAQRITDHNPDFFTELARQQTPKYLWIGCSDSRVPANEIVNLPPGEMFVHRNIANVVVHTDLNCLSVIQGALEMLKVEHIIVCGHYGCSGVKAAMESKAHGLIDNWLRHIQDVQYLHRDKLDHLPQGEQYNKLCELNVVEQVKNVCNTTVVRNAWKRGHRLSVHGWIYDIHNGILEDLGVCISSPQQFTEKYRGEE